MKNGNVLQFSADGTEFIFKFADGSESAAILTKSAGFEAITDLIRREKISVSEFSKFREEILDAENLPYSEEDLETIPSFIGLDGFLMSLMSLMEMRHAPDEPVTVAYYAMCDCGGNHGRIYSKTAFTIRLDSKEEALFYLDHMKKEEIVNEEEYLKVKSEIEASKLA